MKTNVAMNTVLSVVTALLTASCVKAPAPSVFDEPTFGAQGSRIPEPEEPDVEAPGPGDDDIFIEEDDDATFEPNFPTDADVNGLRPDIAISSDIRRALADRGDLSASAKNVQIHVGVGTVSLSGAVRSRAERDLVLAIAEATPGVEEVDNELTIIGN